MREHTSGLRTEVRSRKPRRTGRIILGALIGLMIGAGTSVPALAILGMVIGGYTGGREKRNQPQPPGTPAMQVHGAAIRDFIDSAHRRGVITQEVRQQLRSELAARVLETRATKPKPAAPDPKPPPQPAPRETAQPPPKPSSPPTAKSSAATPSQGLVRRASKPLVAPRAAATQSASRPAPEPTPAQRPRAPAEHRKPEMLEVTMGRLGAAATKAWKSFSTDVAINSFTYLGVLLLVVVMFAFFTLGFYAELVSDPTWRAWRPLVSIGVPTLLFGIAALLRSRSGIPFTANAIGLVAALSLPIMMSALFQDGATWGVPDINGPARWLAYAAVGLILAIVFAVLGRYRSRMYGYLVGPALWTMAGSLGLYLEDGLRILGEGGSIAGFASFTSDGISGYQMAAVLAAMALTAFAADRIKEGAFARTLGTTTVRMTTAALPVVLGIAAAFGISEFRTADDTWALTAAFLFAGVGFVGVARTRRAWQDVGPTLRSWVRVVTASAAHASIVTGLTLMLAIEISLWWVGSGLVTYGLFVLIAEKTLGIEGPASLWAIRATLATGLIVSLGDGWPTVASWGAVLALAGAVVLVPAVRRAADRVAPTSWDQQAAVVGTAAIVTLWLGLARVATAEAGPWTMAVGAVVLGATRFLSPRHGPLRVQSQFTAPVAALGAVAVAGYQVGRGGPMGAEGLGVVLLASAAVAAMMLIPWEIRLPAVVAQAVAGVVLVGRGAWPDIEPSIIDAVVAGSTGLALMIAAVAVARPPLARSLDVTGIVLVYAGVVLGAVDPTSLLVGLTIVLVSHSFAAFFTDRGRSPLASLLPGPRERANQHLAAAYAMVASIALPAVAVLAGDHVWFISAERPRMGPVLAMSSWVYVAVSRSLTPRIIRRMLVTAALGVAGSAIAVAAPSQPALIFTVGSAAAVTAALAWLLRRAAMTVPSWTFGVAFALLVAEAAGVRASDLHFVVIILAAALSLPAALLSRQPKGEAVTISSWRQPPLAIGLLLLPMGMAVAIADRRLLAVLALGACAVYVIESVMLRTGGFTLPAAAMAAIAYTHLIEEWRSPFEEPLWWMPLAAIFAVATTLWPPRGRLFESVGTGMMTAWLGTSAVAATVALRAGSLGWVLVVSAGLLIGYATVHSSSVFFYSGVAVTIAAGATFGVGWLALTLAAAAAATAVHATTARDALLGRRLAYLTTVLAAGSYAALAARAQWSPVQLMAITGATAAIVATAATILWFRDVQGAPGRWIVPLHVISQAGALAVLSLALLSLQASELGQRWEGISPSTGWLALSLLAAAEASLLGISGSVLEDDGFVWAAAGLAALAFTFGGASADWTGAEALVITGSVSLVVAGAATYLWLHRTTGRWGQWTWPLGALGQLGALYVAVIAMSRLSMSNVSPWIASIGRSGAWLALALVASGGATIAGVSGTLLRYRQLVWTSAGLSALAYAMLALAANWPPLPLIAVTAAASIAANATATFILYRSLNDRLRMWMFPLYALSQVGALTVVLVAAAELSPQTASAVTAAALAADAVVAAIVAPRVVIGPTLRISAGVLMAAAGPFASGAFSGQMARVALLSLAGAGASALAASAVRDRHTWSDAGAVFGAATTMASIVIAAARFGVGADTTLGVLILGGAGLIAFGLRSGVWEIAYVGMVLWLNAAFGLTGGLITDNRHALVVSTATVLLVIIEMERYRRRVVGARDGTRHPLAAIRDADLVGIEWFVMATPLALATIDTVLSVPFALLLAAEAGVIFLWALLTEVKRRLLVAVIGLSLAAILPVLVLSAQELRDGLSSGSVLTVGAIAAVTLIVIGSMLERGRARVGRTVERIGVLLEGWQ